MGKIRIPLKFKQIAIDNFLNIPDDAPIVSLMAISGSKQDVSIAAIEVALNWLETHGEALEVKEAVTPGKGLKRLKSCLKKVIEQAENPKTATPKPIKRNQ